ncbi:unannotated protein [freshwater metagenome]|uniref:Unannotated protein n=1 Tax=freshwater metagenome TaxID=449393 RepID=A0A6J7FLP9_9ZZZZ|nr:hypothetical protein [Actinomycetota bacterium]
MSKEIAPLVADALNPEDQAQRDAARKELANLMMDAPGADAFQATLTTILGDAYLVGYRDGGARLKRKGRS